MTQVDGTRSHTSAANPQPPVPEQAQEGETLVTDLFTDPLRDPLGNGLG